MAGGGVDRFALPRRGSVAEAVVRRTQVRAALDDPARHELAGGTAGCVGRHARVARHAAGLRRLRGMSRGAEVAGPSLRSLPVQFRAGYARTQLPFGVEGRTVREQRIAGGLGIPLDRNYAASIDLSIQRVMRSLSGLDARENAWRIGFGVQIRP